MPNDRSYMINNDIYNECGGKNFVFVNGTESIFKHLLLPTVSKCVKLNSEVIKVNWGSKGAVVVETCNETLTADYVIMTASLGFLKKYHKQIFTPPLPQKKREAITHLTYGIAEKFCFLFNDIFWSKELESNPSFAGYGFVFDESNSESLEEAMHGILGPEVRFSGHQITIVYKDRSVDFVKANHD